MNAVSEQLDFSTLTCFSHTKAKWESNLPVKAMAADRKRQATAMLREQRFASKEICEARRKKLAELYAQDDRNYENELYERDLTFRKERA